MNNVYVLDCTLRDGGYCNQWQFGFENTQKITEGLVEANIDVIECGFLTNKVDYNPNITRFRTLEQISMVIPKKRKDKLFVAMMNYGEYHIDDLPDYDGSSIDGIRVAFHKKDLNESLDLCEQIKKKGYKVFVQAMVSLSYSDEEFLSMIRRVNEFSPYAFYIVDSFGMMKNKDLTRLFYMVEHNLKEDILIGFHSHNNMQLAFSNAQALVGVRTNRNLIIDSSIYGMGRGAGNLNTELFIEFLNENYDKSYQLKPLFTIIDEILNDFYHQSYWGYSLPNYISAAHNAHPNYASYFDDKKTLTVENLNEIFELMDSDKKLSFDKAYAENLYIRYMAKGKVQEDHLIELEQLLNEKTILLIAPGKSSINERKEILKAMQSPDVISVSVNFEYDKNETDFIFVSNLRRYRDIDKLNKNKCIITSNITADQVYLQVKYTELLNGVDAVNDNAGLMAIKFFSRYNVKKILLAGFDGYSHDAKENYADNHLSFFTKNAVLDAINEGMKKVLVDYSKSIDIEFLTQPKNVII